MIFLFKTMNEFEREVRQKLKMYGQENKIYLKERYEHEIFHKHNIQDEEINLLFDLKKVMKISPHTSFDDRIQAEIDVTKIKKIKVIFQFDPIVKGQKLIGKVGIITAFSI